MTEKEKKPDLPNAYIVQDMQGNRELERLDVQDSLFTRGMGGVLSEQENPMRFQSVLDIGCGTGGWIIETAKTFPHLTELVGVDVNRSLINYARKQAEEQNVADRVKFEVMDATLMLRFPQNLFDLINLRAGSSFLRTWDWPAIIAEMLRITKSKGILRVTDVNVMAESNSLAFTQLWTMFIDAFYKSGHLFEQSGSGLIDHLPGLLRQHGCKDVRTKIHRINVSSETPEGQAYFKDIEQLVHTIRPFLQKWGSAGKDFDQIGQQVLVDMSQPTFTSTLILLTAWGVKD